jgi:long-chain fatty acid transport protein
MKFRPLLVALCATVPMLSHAGGILTNTNQHINFLRMVARGASTDIDAVYTNPAGLAWLNHNGWTLSFNIQNAAQHRDIHAQYTVLDYSAMQQGLASQPSAETFKQYYGGRASAPVIPSFYAAYQHDRLTVSADAALVGGGGKASYDDGLPMFDSAIRFALANSAALSALSKAVGTRSNSELYDLNTAMSGSQYIYGVQLGVTYKATDWLSAFLGGRMNYFSGNYQGFVDAVVKEQYAPYYQAATGRTDRNLYNLGLDCDQTGWGTHPHHRSRRQEVRLHARLQV